MAAAVWRLDRAQHRSPELPTEYRQRNLTLRKSNLPETGAGEEIHHQLTMNKLKRLDNFVFQGVRCHFPVPLTCTLGVPRWQTFAT